MSVLVWRSVAEVDLLQVGKLVEVGSDLGRGVHPLGRVLGCGPPLVVIYSEIVTRALRTGFDTEVELVFGYLQGTTW